MPSLWPAHSSSGIQKDTEASAGSVAVHGYLGCDLHRHVITPPREQGAVGNLSSSGRSTGKDGLSGEKGEANPRNCLRLPNNDPVPSSTHSYHHCGHFVFPFFFCCGNLPSPPCSREWVSEDSVNVKWRNETCVAMWHIGCTTSLQRFSMPTPVRSVSPWACRDSDSPLNLPGTQRPKVVGLREQLPSEWLSNCYFRNLIL